MSGGYDAFSSFLAKMGFGADAESSVSPEIEADIDEIFAAEGSVYFVPYLQELLTHEKMPNDKATMRKVLAAGLAKLDGKARIKLVQRILADTEDEKGFFGEFVHKALSQYMSELGKASRENKERTLQAFLKSPQWDDMKSRIEVKVRESGRKVDDRQLNGYVVDFIRSVPRAEDLMKSLMNELLSMQEIQSIRSRFEDEIVKNVLGNAGSSY